MSKSKPIKKCLICGKPIRQSESNKSFLCSSCGSMTVREFFRKYNIKWEKDETKKI